MTRGPLWMAVLFGCPATPTPTPPATPVVTPPPATVCGLDAQEPDDLPDQATESASGAGRTCVGDVDHWRTVVPAAASVIIDLRYSAAVGNVDLELYDGDALQLLGAGWTATSDETVRWHNAADAQVEVVSRVYGYDGGEIDYEISASVEACEADAMEPDNVLLTAALAETGSRTLHTVADADWSRVTLQPGQALEVDLGFSQLHGDLIVQLHDFTGQLLRRADTRNDGERLLHYNDTDTPQLVFIVVGASAGSLLDCIPYTFDVRVSDVVCLADSEEPDDTFDERHPPAPDATLMLDDVDWIEVPLVAGVMTRLAVEATEVGVDGVLVDDQAEPIADLPVEVPNFTGVQLDAAVELSVPSDGPGVCGGYAVEVVTRACNAEDSAEPNASVDEALTVPSEPLYLAGEDEDWFDLGPLAAGETTRVRMWSLGGPALIDLDLELWVGDDRVEASATTTQLETVAWTNNRGVEVQPRLRVFHYGALPALPCTTEYTVTVEAP